MRADTRAKLATIKQALLILAGVCNGATSIDGLGFNKIDAQNDLLKKAVRWAEDESKQPLSYRQMTTALRLILKYRKQLLKNAGIALPDQLEELDAIIAADAHHAVAPPVPTAPVPAPPPSQRQSFSTAPADTSATPAPAPAPQGQLSLYERMRYGLTTAPAPMPPQLQQLEDGDEEPEDVPPPTMKPAPPMAKPAPVVVEQPPLDPDHVEFFGVISFIKHGPTNEGFVICTARIVKGLAGDTEGHREVTVKGTIASCRIGAEYKITGKWKDGGIYGRQVQVQVAIERIPENENGLISWLTSIPDIGIVRARAIVSHFGVAACRDILHDDPKRVRDVPGIGAELGAAIARKIEDRAKYAELIVWLGSLGVSHSFIDKIRDLWGEEAQAIVTANPYRLMEVPLIGFKKADAIARSLGIPFDSPFRIAAGILHAISDHCSEKGHCYVPRPDLLVVATETLKVIDKDDKRVTISDVPRQKIAAVIDDLVARGELVEEAWEEDGRSRGGLWPKDLYDSECQVSASMVRLLSRTEHHIQKCGDFDVAMLEEWQSLHGTRLAPHQQDAVMSAMTSPVLVITGGPGTGKTTTVRAIVDMLMKIGRSVALAAPTGRAARRLGQATGRSAMTIHRMVGLSRDANGQRRNDGQWSDASTIILDEVSMVDLPLMRALIRTMHPTKSQLILIGDIDQLPSVGPGSVLRDVLNSGVIPSVRLTQVFRQQGGHENKIISGAHAINSGITPELEPYRGPESFVDGSICWIEMGRDDAEKVPDRIIQVMKDLQLQLTAEGRDDDPFELSQVLTPQRSTAAGVKAINDRLQQEFNADGDPIRDGYWVRIGDKVMQIRNNYDLDMGQGVFNGDVGYVADVDAREKKVIINFEGRPITYKMSETDDVVLAYACTIHKSQGSEYRVIIVVCHSTMFRMLSRQLLYTGVTRGKSTVVIVGDKRGIDRAVANGTVDERYTRLSYRLRECLQQRSQQQGEDTPTNQLGAFHTRPSADPADSDNPFA